MQLPHQSTFCPMNHLYTSALLLTLVLFTSCTKNDAPEQPEETDLQGTAEQTPLEPEPETMVEFPPTEAETAPPEESAAITGDQTPFEIRAKNRTTTLTDKTGRQIVAEIVEVNEASLQVIRGREIRKLTIPFELLSDRDRSFAEYLLQQKQTAADEADLADFRFHSELTVNSVKELVAAAKGSNQKITMAPGVYQMKDYLSPKVISETVPHPVMGAAMITISGDNNFFDFTGVTIEVDTQLLNDFKQKSMEFYITGNGNLIKGLTVTDLGNAPTAGGGQSFVVDGKDNTIKNVTLNVSGSSPYGYGDLLGKGGGALAPLRKHSGMLITGENIKILDCSVYSKAFGHLFFIQGGRDVLFENCYAEAVIRTTDAMLAETSGLAFDRDFAAVYPNYDGEKVITPGYTKSLSECGFRMYGRGGPNQRATGAVTLINCRAKHCRVGFAMTRIEGDVLIENCEAIGCESGYNIAGTVVKNSRGDAVNGPLLYVNPDDTPCEVDLALMPEVNTTTLHAIAAIAGDDHVIRLTNWQDTPRTQQDPIRLGWSRPTATNPYSPMGTRQTSGVTLINETSMPILVSETAEDSRIFTNTEVENKGRKIKVEPLSKASYADR